MREIKFIEGLKIVALLTAKAFATIAMIGGVYGTIDYLVSIFKEGIL